MKTLLVLFFLCAPLHAALWIYYPAAYATYGEKSDGTNLVEMTGLISVSRNDRQIYTLAYTQDKLDGEDWKYTQHTGLVAGTWPLSSWTLSCAVGMVNGRLSEVPEEYAPLNKGALGAARILRQEGEVQWGFAGDSYDEPSGLHIRHGVVLTQWAPSTQFSVGVSENAAMQLGQPDRFSTTVESCWDPLHTIHLQADYMFGQNSLPFSWNTLVLNNTPAKINEMWGAKCEWSATSALRMTVGYRFTGYENADADYFYAGIRVRFLSY
ncbi:MAG: hypothetical protein IPP40_08715 [bacterium]|nr:hypothetical protein [bacterium]